MLTNICFAQPLTGEISYENVVNELMGAWEVTSIQTYNIVSIPTLILFKDGKIKTRLTGLQSKTQILNEINKL